MNDSKYVVKKGDSLWKIAQNLMEYPQAWPLLLKYNEDTILDKDRIFPGQVLLLPPTWIKPKKSAPSPRPIKVNLTVREVEKKSDLAVAGAYEADLIPPLVLKTPVYNYKIMFKGKFIVSNREDQDSLVEFSNTGVSMTSEQKINSAVNDLVRKVEVKVHDNKDLSLKSTLTTASFGKNTYTVSHSLEFKRNGKTVYIYEVDLPNELKGKFKGCDFLLKDFKYLVEVEANNLKNSDDENKSSGWKVLAILAVSIAVIALIAFALIVWLGVTLVAILKAIIAGLAIASGTSAGYATTVDEKPVYVKYKK